MNSMDIAPDPLEDAGSGTASRFYFQYQCAARHCFSMATDARLSWILCEWHSDYVIGYTDGTEQLVSVKHRDLDQGRWTLAELWNRGGLVKLFETWLNLGRSHLCLLSTNAGLEPGHGRAAHFADACNRGGDALDLFVDTAASRLRCSRDEAHQFLASLTIEAELPDRAKIRTMSIADVAAPALQALNAATTPPERAWDAVVGLVAARSRDLDGAPVDPLGSLGDWRRLNTSRAELAKGRRRIDRDQILLLLANARIDDHAAHGRGALNNLGSRRGAERFVARLGTQRAIEAAAEHDAPGTVALVGVSGAGKTEMAFRYAIQQLTDAEIVWWIRADTAHSTMEDLASLSVALGVPHPSGPLGLEPLHHALQQRNSLLIADNAAHDTSILELLPLGMSPVLITTNDHRWEVSATTVPVEAMSPSEANAYLSMRLPRTEPNTLYQLAEVLERLPLALEQASAYMIFTGMSVDAYLRLLETRPGSLLDRGTSPRHPGVVATLAVTMQSVSKDPDALALLRILSMLGQDDFPTELFAISAMDEAPGIYDDASAEIAAFGNLAETEPLHDPLILHDAIAILRQFSLVRVSPTGLAMHSLTKLVVRDLYIENHDRVLASALDLLLRVASRVDADNPNNWPALAQLIPHIDATLVFAADRWPRNALVMHGLAAEYLAASGLRQEAVDHARLLAELAPASRDPAGVLLQAAQIHLQADHFHDAQRLAEQAFQKESEQDRPLRRAAILNVRALALRGLGQLDAALDALESASALIADPDTAMDPEFDPLETRLMLNANRANFLSDSSDPKAAVLALRECLKDAVEVEGADGPRAAVIRSNLCLALVATGDFAQAEREASTAARIDEFLHGPNHITVSRDINNRGLARHEAGRYVEAQQDFKRALDLEEASNGDQTLRAAQIRDNLGRVAEKLGDLDLALKYFEEAVTIQTRLLGSDCRENANTLNNMCGVVSEKGDPAKALTLARQALDIDEKIFGKGHHATAPDMHNIAVQLTKLGLLPAARKWMQRSHDVSLAQLGRRHPSCAFALVQLGVIAAMEGNLDDARNKVTEGQAILQDVLGSSHPLTQQAREYLESIAIATDGLTFWLPESQVTSKDPGVARAAAQLRNWKSQD